MTILDVDRFNNVGVSTMRNWVHAMVGLSLEFKQRTTGMEVPVNYLFIQALAFFLTACLGIDTHTSHVSQL